jgi:hypothetical protein
MDPEYGKQSCKRQERKRRMFFANLCCCCVAGVCSLSQFGRCSVVFVGFEIDWFLVFRLSVRQSVGTGSASEKSVVSHG